MYFILAIKSQYHHAYGTYFIILGGYAIRIEYILCCYEYVTGASSANDKNVSIWQRISI